VLGKKWEEIKIKSPRTSRYMPDILSAEEVQRMISLTENKKHKAMIAVGVRREELLNLKLKDIDSKRKLIRVHQGKGDKSRGSWPKTP
jgi:integrase